LGGEPEGGANRGGSGDNLAESEQAKKKKILHCTIMWEEKGGGGVLSPQIPERRGEGSRRRGGSKNFLQGTKKLGHSRKGNNSRG